MAYTIINVREAAQILGCSESTVHAMVKKGTLKIDPQGHQGPPSEGAEGRRMNLKTVAFYLEPIQQRADAMAKTKLELTEVKQKRASRKTTKISDPESTAVLDAGQLRAIVEEAVNTAVGKHLAPLERLLREHLS